MLVNLQSIQVLGVCFSAFLFIVVFLMLKQRLIQDKYSLIWFFVSFVVFVMSAWSELMEALADIIGVYYPPSLFFMILIVCIYFLLLNMSVSLSKLRSYNKALTQEVALLRLRLEDLEQQRCPQQSKPLTKDCEHD